MSHLLRALWVGTVSRTFLVWADLDSFKEHWNLVDRPSVWSCLVFFSWVVGCSPGVMGHGRKTTEVKPHIHHIISRVHAINMLITVDIVLDHLAKVAFVRLLCCEVSLFSLLSYSALQKESLCAAHTHKTGSYAAPPWWGRGSINYFEFFYMFFFPIYLLIQLSMSV